MPHLNNSLLPICKLDRKISSVLQTFYLFIYEFSFVQSIDNNCANQQEKYI